MHLYNAMCELTSKTDVITQIHAYCSADVAEVLLRGTYASSLCEVFSAATFALRSRTMGIERSTKHMEELVSGIENASKMIIKADAVADQSDAAVITLTATTTPPPPPPVAAASRGKVKKIRGRVLLGEKALPALLDALLLLKYVFFFPRCQKQLHFPDSASSSSLSFPVIWQIHPLAPSSPSLN